MPKLNKHNTQLMNLILDSVGKIIEKPSVCVDLIDTLPENASAIICEILGERIHTNARIEDYETNQIRDFNAKESDSVLIAVDKLHDKSSEEIISYLKDFRFEAGLCVMDIIHYERHENNFFAQYAKNYAQNALTGSKKFASKEEIKSTAQHLQHILVNFYDEKITANEALGLLQTKDFFARKALRDEAYADLQKLDSKINPQTLETLERKRKGLNPYYATNDEAQKAQKEEIRQRNEIRQRLETTRLRHQNKKRSVLSKFIRSLGKSMSN